MSETATFTIDATPATDQDVETEYSCKHCGHALTYGGAGRKPSACTDRNGGDPACIESRKGTRSTTKRAPSNDKLAQQATDVLIGMNEFIGTGAFFVGFTGTASAIAKHNEDFGIRAYNALIMDPALCKMILRGGMNSGRLALVLAYGMFAAKVAPVAAQEYREMRAQAQAERETEDVAA